MTPRKDRPTPDPRHGKVKEMLEQYWHRESPMLPTLPWGPGEAGALGAFLRANPDLDIETIGRCLLHRLASDDHAPAERIYVWIGDVLRYAAAPLDRYRLPKRTSSEATVGMFIEGAEPMALPSDVESLAAMMGPASVARVRKLHAEGGYLQDWERRMLRELGDL